MLVKRKYCLRSGEDMKSDKTDRSNYRGITLLSTTYKMLSNMLLSRLPPYAEGMFGDHQCGI
jgi:hypothetical protein